MPKDQNVSASSPPLDAPLKVVDLTPQDDLPQGVFQVFDHLLGDADTAAIALIPAELVSLHAIDLPVRTTRQQQDALPFALEDKVARSLEHTHFAHCGVNAHGNVLAAVLDNDALKSAIDGNPGAVVFPEQMLLAAPERDDEEGVTWSAYHKDKRVLVRGSDGTGFALHIDVFPHVWRVAGAPKVHGYGDDLPAEINAVAHTDLPPLASLTTADLRQGAYQPSRRLARPLKWLAACLALAGIAHLAIAVADVEAQRKIADTLRNEARVALATALPSASVDDVPALVLRQIAARNQPQRGSGFLPLMEQVSDALSSTSTTVGFRELSWSDNALRLSVEALNLDALQQVEAALRASGLSVSSGSATADGGAARAELTVRP